MKQLLKLTALMAAILIFAACQKEKDEIRHDRYISYTVSDNTPQQSRSLPSVNRLKESSQTFTVHLTTEEEWQDLLNLFCDYAKNGKSVIFYNESHVPAKKKDTPKETITFSTTDRDEMKNWMSQMEDKGMTVTVTYDPVTGIWNGLAYSLAPQPPLPSGGLLTYECDQMPLFGYIMSFDTVSRRVYITLHDTRQNVTNSDYPVGEYEYLYADDKDIPFGYWFIDVWGDTVGLYSLEFVGSLDACGSDTMHYNSTIFNNPATLVRTNDWQTYISVDDVSNAAIVMHVNVHALDGTPELYIGQANSNYDDRHAYGFGRFVIKRTNSINYNNEQLYFLSLDFTLFGINDIYSDFLIGGEPTVDNQFTISHGLYHDNYAPYGIGITNQDYFYRL